MNNDVANINKNPSKEVRNLVDWPNPPELADLKNDFTEALSNHNHMVDRVNTWVSALRGEVKFKVMDGRSRMQPKLIRKQCEWRYSSLEEPFLSTSDMFKIHPATYDDIKSAKQNEIILNKQFRVDINKISFINKYIRNAVNHGTVIAKLSWETQTDIVTEEVPVYTQSPEETMMYLQQMVQAQQIAPEQAQQIAMSGEPIQIGKEPQEVEKEVINRPVIEIKDCRNIIIDPSCEGDIDNAQFIIDRFLTDMSTLRKDGRYKNLDLLDQRNDYQTDERYYYDNDKPNPDFKFNDAPRKKMIAYEYWGFWDIDGNGVVKPIVATWVGETLIRLEENPFPDKQLPFVVVQYLPPDTETVYGDSDASLLIENQNIVGAVTRSMIDLIGRSANAQKGVRKDLLDPLNRDRFNKGLDFEFNPINGGINDGFYMTQLPEIPRSALEVIQLMQNEAESLTGVKAFSQGLQSQAIGDSVGGIRSALDAVSKRELSILRRLADGLKKIGRKIIAMNSVWLADEEIIRITDEEFIAIKRSDLAGNFDLVVDVSTAESDNQKASELAFMLQTMGNSVPFDITKLVLAKIADLRKLPDLAKAIEEYQPQSDPLAQEHAQLEIEMLKAQVINEQAKGEENATDVQLKQAKTQTELAKAKATSATADKTNLDYLEQASGLQHNRELELKSVDHRNQMERERQKAQNDMLRERQKSQNDILKSQMQYNNDLGKMNLQNINDLDKLRLTNIHDITKTGLQLKNNLEKEALGLKYKNRINRESKYGK